MSFVPAGYYDCDDGEDDFDFGDDIAQGQYQVTRVPVAAPAPAPAGQGDLCAASSNRGASVEAGKEDDAAPVEKGNLSLASPASNCHRSRNQEGEEEGDSKNGSGCSPVRFNISPGSPESEVESCHDNSDRRNVVGVPPEVLTSALNRGYGGRSREPVVERSRGRREEEDEGSKARLSELEMLEGMKVALRQGNVEEVTRMLDTGVCHKYLNSGQKLAVVTTEQYCNKSLKIVAQASNN